MNTYSPDEKRITKELHIKENNALEVVFPSLSSSSLDFSFYSCKIHLVSSNFRKKKCNIEHYISSSACN